ncbi:MAG: hypothetical protein BGN99_21690 [Alphaproteobacteria bacterium 65-37]|nr:MAG: hypothetical protein BGN99_21690 [Alphaproteobacteria bacterium 65-37]
MEERQTAASAMAFLEVVSRAVAEIVMANVLNATRAASTIVASVRSGKPAHPSLRLGSRGYMGKACRQRNGIHMDFSDNESG